MQIKILFVVNSWGARGAEQQLADLRRCLPKQIITDMFAFNKEGTKSAFIIDSKTGANGSLVKVFLNNILIKSFVLFLLMKKQQYNVIVTEGLGTALFVGRVGWVFSKIPVVYSTLLTLKNFNRNDNRYFEPANAMINYILPRISRKRKFRFLAKCTVLREKIKSQVPSSYPVEIFWNAISVDSFLHNTQSGDVSSELRLVSDNVVKRPCIIQIGSLDENKNQIFTLRCFKELRNKIPDICLLLVGDGPMRSLLTEYIEAESLENNVFIVGQIGRSDCSYLIGKSNILVLTSYSEAFPNVFLEAHLQGIPIVSFEVGAASDIILDGHNGFLTKINAAEVFQERIIDLLYHPDKAKAFGLEGKKRLYQKFTMERKVEYFLQMIEKDLSKSEL